MSCKIHHTLTSSIRLRFADTVASAQCHHGPKTVCRKAYLLNGMLERSISFPFKLALFRNLWMRNNKNMFVHESHFPMYTTHTLHTIPSSSSICYVPCQIMLWIFLPSNVCLQASVFTSCGTKCQIISNGLKSDMSMPCGNVYFASTFLRAKRWSRFR